jgi:mRNA interferase RelE/StbE
MDKMRYIIEIKPKAIKDGKKIPNNLLKRIFDKIEQLADDLQGDVKHLTNYTPEYRLRVGEYRVLFEIESNVISVYRIKHRRNAYR